MKAFAITMLIPILPISILLFVGTVQACILGLRNKEPKLTDRLAKSFWDAFMLTLMFFCLSGVLFGMIFG